jgi:hypothetical protein
LAADLRVEITWNTGVSAFILPNDYVTSAGGTTVGALGFFDNFPSYTATVNNAPVPAPVTGATQVAVPLVNRTTALTAVTYTVFTIFLHCGVCLHCSSTESP